MKETIVHGWGKLAHSPELAGSWFSRLPKLVAALLVAGTSSRAAQATNGASFFIRLLLEIARSAPILSPNAGGLQIDGRRDRVAGRSDSHPTRLRSGNETPQGWWRTPGPGRRHRNRLAAGPGKRRRRSSRARAERADRVCERARRRNHRPERRGGPDLASRHARRNPHAPHYHHRHSAPPAPRLEPGPHEARLRGRAL